MWTMQKGGTRKAGCFALGKASKKMADIGIHII